MKNLFLLLLLVTGSTLFAQVAINTDGTSADNSAMLEVKSTTKGFLPPRMTYAQRNALLTPAKGLMIFQTDVTPGLYFNTGTTTTPVWTMAGTSTGQWLTNGTGIYYSTGNVGIGTNAPTHPLTVKSSVLSDDMIRMINGSDNPVIRFRQNSNGSGGVYVYDGTGANTIFFYGDGNSFINSGRLAIGHTSPGAGLHLKGTAFPESFLFLEGTTGIDAGIRLYEAGVAKWHLYNDVGLGGFALLNNAGLTSLFAKQSNGYVGIGTNTPDALLDVSGNLIVSNSGKLGIATASPVNMLDVHGTSSIMSGYLGIGTTSPGTGLHVKGTNWPSSFIQVESNTSADAGIRFSEGGTARWSIFNDPGSPSGLRIYNTSGHTAIFISQTSSYVGIHNSNPAAELDVSGNIIVRDPATDDIAIELGTGLDYAEGFDITDQEEVLPGTVVCLDPSVPGKLQVSRQSYDRKVAGIVAGANKLGSGIVLGSGTHQINVALAGRVFCNVVAGPEGIQIGDLLTTSEIPGYAMKADDFTKSGGAILGKAMENLGKDSKGQILVLVTLQ